ncbi:Vacuolar fusion protein CCZ1 [Hypsizygus marmoreus]|uniref:Vacuolar fusion protein CCZ1 n=1 Tax=Hypsizygus marmoreus TaxID=39966 RepID=A0A369J1A0_HYPMA|nr:Vacuolar fusion protein CCZ1 [Hypsizygus marmoreus]
MSKIPPNLLYLTIYNSTLRPTAPIPEEDEDAEEQAHILFYTSKERAVSRDRMLRQIGLAKALVNFSEMFNATDSCDSVHSQCKRLIMVSPEPDFWIHAGVEVAKVPRAPDEKGKGKVKEKPQATGKGKEKETDPAPTYDYLEGSVHDLSLRADIMCAYERFKLTHGSFTSLLSAVGQQALELQLERFFTVWAWSWNLEDGTDFRDQLGVPLHPSFRSVVPLLDRYSSELPSGSTSIFLTPPCIVPSTQYTAANHPSSLARHLLSLIPPAQPSSASMPVYDRDGTIKGKHLSDPDSASGKDPPKGQDSSANTFLGMPTVTMNVNWSWPGYLSFGRGPGKRTALEDPRKIPIPIDPLKTTETRPPEPVVDTSALEDAISGNMSISPSPSTETNSSGVDTTPAPSEEIATSPTSAEAVDVTTSNGSHTNDTHAFTDADSASLAPSIHSSVPSTPESPPPEFSTTSVYLSEPDTPLITARSKVHYVQKGQTMLAVVGLDEEVATGSPDLARTALTLLDEIETVITTDLVKLNSDLLPSASKILQPTDSHIISSNQYTVSSPGFSSKSSHLFAAQELQALDPDISEVFSRGLNPQHWHIARRGLGLNDNGIMNDGEVYMEVFRKEASLGDVDNVLAGVIRRCGLLDGPL